MIAATKFARQVLFELVGLLCAIVTPLAILIFAYAIWSE